MRKVPVFFILLLIFSALFILHPRRSAAANCQLTSASFSKQTIIVGESFSISATGQNCGGQNVTGNIYGKYSLGTFLIKGVRLSFPANSTNATTTTSISQSDVSGRNGDITAYLEVITDDGFSSSDSSFITIKASPDCVLGSASWIAEKGVGGRPVAHVGGPPVTLKVTGQGCDGLDVSLDLYGKDGGYITYVPRRGITTIKSTFTNGSATANYTFSQDDYKKGGGSLLLDEITFDAKVFAAGNQIGKLTSNDLALLPTGNKNLFIWACLADNGVYACSPGNKQDLSDVPNNACSGKAPIQIDVLKCSTSSGGPGSGPGTGTGGSNPPGTTQTYNFGIENPIGATDLVDLINVIATWLLNIAIPIAVIMIIYAGIIFLTSHGDMAKVGQAKKILLYAVVGLSIILVGKGFITLIKSILALKSG